MKYLLDTHLLLWAAGDTLPRTARKYFSQENILFFSPASLWEIVIKRTLNREDFQIDPQAFHKGLLAAGYLEIPITSQHALAIDSLPQIHKDPFDRILLAQAIVEKMDLLTADTSLAKYPDHVTTV